MLAASARSPANIAETEEDEVLASEKLSRDQKAKALQDFLFLAASNGDVERVRRLVRGEASELLEIDAADAEGTPPMIYAACFGHKEVVVSLLNAGASVDNQDKNQWTALMWAITNSHQDIAKLLLDHGASTEVKSSSGRTALDFIPPGTVMSEFLKHNGYSIGESLQSLDKPIGNMTADFGPF